MLTHSFKRPSLSNLEMYSLERRLTIRSTRWPPLGKYNLNFNKLNHNYLFRFNAKWIPTTDETLNATSRRYGTETFPITHPHNHSKYPPNETTFRASYVDPKTQPKSVFKDRDPSKEFTNEKTVKIHEHIQDKTNLYGPR